MDSIRISAKKFMRKIAKWINTTANGRITANHVTIASLLLHIPIFFAIVAEQYILAAIMLAIFGIMDSLDGELARLQGRASKAGMLLDASTDRMKEGIIFMALGYRFALDGEPKAVLATFAAATGAFAVSYVKAKGETALTGSGLHTQEINRIFQAGFMRYEVRTIFIIIGLLFNSVLLPIIWLVALLSWLTAFYRLAAISRKLSR